ncbi:hypothetical protein [Aquimarina sp. 2201CG5-10]|uniref:hypothetical protein n=1 Tax=Aquimarina callyspongiae TaxID=3098150 RepID=UPI002AB3B050|nr:hypothetical protein [Aquimarina sp. 2201CG5-10]MDY8134100.1 hypothetical protein [Aquimarina sp. 2201CG5-10]
MEEQFKNIKGLVKEAGLEKPSVGFLQNVMSQVNALEIQSSIEYKPLISRKAWIVIALIVLSILISVFYFSNNNEPILRRFDLSFLQKIEFKNPLSDFTLHKTTTYGILFLAALFFLQVTLLKRRIDRIFSL